MATIHPVFRYEGDTPVPTMNAIRETAQQIGCSVAALEAVIAVEASGRWYHADGSFIRRLEPHHLPDYIRRAVGFSGNWRDSLRISRRDRARMFKTAYDIDPEAACYAASWGAFQFMGFNATYCGFDSAVSMCHAFEKDVNAQLAAFVGFCQHTGADGALRAQDWHTFARLYNGTGQPAVYARKIERAFTRANNGTGSPTILRMGDRGASVRELQRALASNGYAVDVDGVFGPQTLDAVRDYQNDHGLAVDGVVGARTWASLRAETRHEPRPDVQATTGEDVLDKVAKGTGALTAVSGAVAPLVGDNPSDPVRIALIAAVGVLGAIALAAYLFRRNNHTNRRA